MKPQRPEFAHPFVSVIMPVRNEGRFIDLSLGAVLAQDYPADRFEVLVVDGSSTDGTRERLAEISRTDSRVRVLDNPRRIVPPALNIALREVRGSVVVRVDGHCEIAPDYVSKAVRHLQVDCVDAVGGPLDTVGETWAARVIAAAMSSPFGVGGSAFRTRSNETMLTDTVAFPAYSAAILRAAGPFDEELVRNQDDEYNYRIRKMGGRVLLAADVRARYFSRSGFRALWRQYLQYGYWKVRVMQKHPRQMRWRQFVPAAFVLSLLGALALAVTPVGWRAAELLIALYAIAIGAAATQVTRRRGWRLLSGLVLAFPILHVSYGLGFLTGIVRFAGRWFDEPEKLAPLPVAERPHA
jgi:glycosyltransferase involved in cell wall biosynthesis